jgi:hypothetical protein
VPHQKERAGQERVLKHLHSIDAIHARPDAGNRPQNVGPKRFCTNTLRKIRLFSTVGLIANNAGRIELTFRRTFSLEVVEAEATRDEVTDCRR